jgi:hypothetical protein
MHYGYYGYPDEYNIASDLSTKIAENMYLANPSELIFL